MTHRTTEAETRTLKANLLTIGALVTVILVVITSIVFAHNAQTDRPHGFTPVVVRGGGFVTGLTVQGDSMYARTDIGGAYRFDRKNRRWVQMITTASMPSDRRPTDYQVEALGAAPSDPTTVYMLVGSTSDESPGARVLRSHDAGKSWTAHPVGWYVGGNDKWRQSGARIAVDPSDPGTLFVGTRRDGLQVSRDGGESWETAVLPTGLDSTSNLYSIGVSSVLIDQSSSIIDGRHSVVWAGVAGVGLTRSLDGGRTWATVSAFENGFVSDLASMSDGAVVASFYGVGDVSNKSYVRRVNATGEVVDITPPADARWLTLATDPGRPGTLVVAPEAVKKGVGLFTTRNAEAPVPEWTATSTHIADGADGTTWPTESDVFDRLSTGQIRFFDNRIWFAEGMGMWNASPEFSDTIKWRFFSDGIEELLGNSIFKPANGALLTAQWDRGLMRHPDPTDRSPAEGQEAGFPYTSRFGAAWDISASPTDPNFLVVIIDDYQDLTGRTVPERRASGYSTDGGATWHRFAALANGTAPPDLLLGNIAVSAHDSGNLVWIPSNLSGAETKIYYSRDAGATWSMGQLNGIGPEQFLHRKYVQARKILIADPNVQGAFYALGSDDSGRAILWKSADGGASWNIAWLSDPAEDNTSGFKFDSTLVAAGRYLIAAPGGRGGCLYRSQGGTDWEKICSIRDALGIGVGAPIEDGGSAALYSYGTVGGDTGIFRSTDYGTNWDRLSGDPDDMYVGVRAIAGDPMVAGRFYVALAGGGFVVGQF